jgi:hypothetical protein
MRKLICVTYKLSLRTAQRTQSVSIRNDNVLVLQDEWQGNLCVLQGLYGRDSKIFGQNTEL